MTAGIHDKACGMQFADQPHQNHLKVVKVGILEPSLRPGELDSTGCSLAMFVTRTPDNSYQPKFENRTCRLKHHTARDSPGEVFKNTDPGGSLRDSIHER